MLERGGGVRRVATPYKAVRGPATRRVLQGHSWRRGGGNRGEAATCAAMSHRRAATTGRRADLAQINPHAAKLDLVTPYMGSGQRADSRASSGVVVIPGHDRLRLCRTGGLC